MITQSVSSNSTIIKEKIISLQGQIQDCNGTGPAGGINCQGMRKKKKGPPKKMRRKNRISRRKWRNRNSSML